MSSCFRVIFEKWRGNRPFGLRKEAEFFAALDGLGAAGGSEFVESAGAVGLDGVFGDKELGGDLPIAEAARDQGKDFELACCDAEALLARCVGSEGDRSRGGNHDLSHDHGFPSGFADGFAGAGDAQAEPDAEGGKEDGDQRSVKLNRVLEDHETVFGVLEDGDEEAADDTEDEDVPPHDGWKKYSGGRTASLKTSAESDSASGRRAPDGASVFSFNG